MYSFIPLLLSIILISIPFVIGWNTIIGMPSFITTILPKQRRRIIQKVTLTTTTTYRYYQSPNPLLLLDILLSSYPKSRRNNRISTVLFQSSNNNNNNNDPAIITTIPSSKIIQQDDEPIDVLLSSLPKRDMKLLLSWAKDNGILIDTNYINIVPTATTNTINKKDNNNNNDQETNDTFDDIDWYVTSIQPLQQDTVLMTIPSNIILSSHRIEQQYKDQIQESLKILQNSTTSQSMISEFYIILQILIEISKGTSSIWYGWIQSLPKQQQLTTALDMTDTEIDCLPMFGKVMATNWIQQYKNLFLPAIQTIPNTILPLTIQQNTNLLRWAYTIVYTRCWYYNDDDDDDEGNNNNNNDRKKRCDLVPVGDMFNHNENQNINLRYTQDGSKIVLSARYNITESKIPLVLSYGKVTNPYRYLLIFGFVDTNQQEMFSHIIIVPTKEKPEYYNLGYPTDLVFRTVDGSISNAVYNFILYTYLEQQQHDNTDNECIEFYNAIIEKNRTVVQKYHTKYHYITLYLLKNHVDNMINNLFDLRTKIDNILNTTTTDTTRLQLIRQNNVFITNVFIKVQQNIVQMI